MSRANYIISLFTGLLVALLAAAAFRLSFDALNHLVISNGVPAKMAWLYPAIVDGAIIIFSISVLQASLNRNKAHYPWLLVGLFTILSVILNIVHAPPDLLARVLAAIPPIALFLSFELLMNQIKSIVRRAAAIQSLAELFEAIQKKRQELNALIQHKQGELDQIVHERTTQLDKLNKQLERLETKKNDLNEMRREKRGFRSRLEGINADRTEAKQEALNILLDYLTEHPDATLSQMSSTVGRAKSTISGYVSELEESGRLHKNGHGWEVHPT